MEKNLTLSVHQLVDFLLRTGDIDNRIYNSATMQEGTLLHAMYQSRQGDNYISEYNLIEIFKVRDFQVRLEGRADGIIEAGEMRHPVSHIRLGRHNLRERRTRPGRIHRTGVLAEPGAPCQARCPEEQGREHSEGDAACGRCHRLLPRHLRERGLGHPCLVR